MKKTIILLFIVIKATIALAGQVPLNYYAEKYFNQAQELSYTMLDSSIVLTQKSLEYYKKIPDTAGILKCMLRIADLEKNAGGYYLAFDYLWEAQFIAENYGDKNIIAKIHEELGIMNTFFQRKKDAYFHYNKALAIRKEMKNAPEALASAYYALALRYREDNNYALASAYLDSCSFINRNKKSYYVIAEKGFVAMKKGEYEKAEKLLFESHDYFESNNLHYLIVVNSFLGDFMTETGKIDMAIKYFEKSLLKIEEFKSHTNIQHDILVKLSNLYLKKNNTDKAYFFLSKSKNISDSLFNVKTGVAAKLFNIKNRYTEKINQQEKILNEQKALLEMNKQKYFKLQLIIVLILLTVVVALLIIRSKYQKRKYHQEKKHAETLIQLEREKLEAVNEVKNKEITAFTLQLIEKETQMKEMVDFIRANVTDSPERRLVIKNATIQIDLWEEFNTRFIEVHSGFYERLVAKFPKLTPTELKHCALIKLNFSSKEMAHLLNISVSSTHISRHRIRKKLNLSREDNLETFIAGLF